MATTISVKVNKGQTYSEALTKAGVGDPTRTNYVFIGWNTKADGTGETRTPNQAIVKSETIYAKWSQITYTVTFDLAGGTRTGGGALVQTVAHGSSATAPTCTRLGYNFVGWSGNYTNVTSDRTITAIWKADLTNNLISVSYSGNDVRAVALSAVKSQVAVSLASFGDGLPVTGGSTIPLNGKNGDPISAGGWTDWYVDGVEPSEDEFYYYIY